MELQKSTKIEPDDVDDVYEDEIDEEERVPSDMETTTNTEHPTEQVHNAEHVHKTSSTASVDLATVDLAQLGDLFSLPQAPATVSTYQIAPHASLGGGSHNVTVISSTPTEVTVIASLPQISIPATSQQTIIPINPLPNSKSETGKVFAKKSTPASAADTYTPVYIIPDTEVPIIDCGPLLQAENKANLQPVSGTVEIQNADPTVTNTPPTVGPKIKKDMFTPEKTSAGIPTVPCPQCDKKFMRPYNMRVHVDRVHNKVKPWACQFCEKIFATTSDLKQHLASHGFGKIHKCEDCGREFNNRDSAILHRKQHNNERTHFCQECGKGFFKASCLQRHMRSHTGEKPYVCDHCGRRFAQGTTAKNHKKVCKANQKVPEPESDVPV